MTEFKIFRDSSAAIDIPEGSVLFNEGDPGDVMYAIVDGQVDVTLHGELIETLGPLSIVGEMALIDSAPRSTTAVARTASRIVSVDHRHFLFLVHEHPTFSCR